MPARRVSILLRVVSSTVAALLLAGGLTVGSATLGAAPESQAADLSQFQAGNIISDALFFDPHAMTVDEIQAFLNSKVPSCAGGYTCLKDYHEDTHTVSGNPMCDTYLGAANESAAMIIYRVSALCGISSKAILVMLQKEQGLVTATSPSAGRFESAMGAGCPDTAACDSDYYGFYNQVRYGSYLLKRYTQPTGTGPGTDWDTRYDLMKPVGQVSQIQYNPNAGCGTQSVLISNQATHSLYMYTPYTPNAAALAAGYGVGDGCSSYGNRNFFQFYSDWFGSTQVTTPVATVNPSVTGTAAVGSTLTANNGTWSGLPVGTFQPSGANATRTFNGYNVQAIQNALNVAGIPTTIDGIYGPQTTGNVRAYQSRYGLTVDGVVGPQTWGHMSSLTDASSTFEYAWLSCTSPITAATTTAPTACATIAGAAGPAYVLAAGDAGRFVAAQITATNRSGTTSKWTATTAAVTGPPLAAVTATIAGSPIVGASLTADISSAPTGTAATFAWYVCASEHTAAAGTKPADCALIPDATQSNYVPVTADITKFLSVSVTVTDGTTALTTWSATTGAVVAADAPAGPTPTPSPSPDSPTPSPSPTASPSPSPSPSSGPSTPPLAGDPAIAGSAVVGSVLTAGPGTWTGLPIAPFVPSGPNAGRSFNGYNVQAIQNALTGAGIPTTIDGIYGPQTTANVRGYQSRYGLTVDGIVGPQTWGHMSSLASAPATFAYSWYSCSTAIAAAAGVAPTDCRPIAGATSATYTPVSADAGALLAAQITATNSAGSAVRWTPTTTTVAP